jgi:hypothetical protein
MAQTPEINTEQAPAKSGRQRHSWGELRPYLSYKVLELPVSIALLLAGWVVRDFHNAGLVLGAAALAVLVFGLITED